MFRARARVPSGGGARVRQGGWAEPKLRQSTLGTLARWSDEMTEVLPLSPSARWLLQGQGLCLLWSEVSCKPTDLGSDVTLISHVPLFYCGKLQVVIFMSMIN